MSQHGAQGHQTCTKKSRTIKTNAKINVLQSIQKNCVRYLPTLAQHLPRELAITALQKETSFFRGEARNILVKGSDRAALGISGVAHHVKCCANTRSVCLAAWNANQNERAFRILVNIRKRQINCLTLSEATEPLEHYGHFVVQLGSMGCGTKEFQNLVACENCCSFGFLEFCFLVKQNRCLWQVLVQINSLLSEKNGFDPRDAGCDCVGLVFVRQILHVSSNYCPINVVGCEVVICEPIDEVDVVLVICSAACLRDQSMV
jgi:hypothetical protein